jgi:hypothetical protein
VAVAVAVVVVVVAAVYRDRIGTVHHIDCFVFR